MNKYYRILDKILATGKTQTNKKGNIQYLLNEQLSLTPADLLDIFEGHNIARKKLRSELQLFMQGERNVEKYREVGINWWDYCGSILVNSYPTYFEKLPPLIAKINRERRNSKNYVLFLGEDTVRRPLFHVPPATRFPTAPRMKWSLPTLPRRRAERFRSDILSHF